jgi:hypothetical protein
MEKEISSMLMLLPWVRRFLKVHIVLDDIGKLNYVHRIVREGKANIKFIINDHESQTLFRK